MNYDTKHKGYDIKVRPFIMNDFSDGVFISVFKINPPSSGPLRTARVSEDDIEDWGIQGKDAIAEAINHIKQEIDAGRIY
jgi:hypothetical protein